MKTLDKQKVIQVLQNSVNQLPITQFEVPPIFGMLLGEPEPGQEKAWINNLLSGFVEGLTQEQLKTMLTIAKDLSNLVE